jgi:hypothetical protein
MRTDQAWIDLTPRFVSPSNAAPGSAVTVLLSITSLILLAGIVTKSAIVPLAVPADSAQPETSGARAAQRFRAAGQPVEPVSETTVLSRARPRQGDRASFGI